jgi:hypothetical protein
VPLTVITLEAIIAAGLIVVFWGSSTEVLGTYTSRPLP